jgi:hypothetical protein
VEPEVASNAEIPPEDAGVKTSVNREKPGRPRLHRRQQSLFLPSAMRCSLVSTLSADPAKKKFFNKTETPLVKW